MEAPRPYFGVFWMRLFSNYLSVYYYMNTLCNYFRQIHCLVMIVLKEVTFLSIVGYQIFKDLLGSKH